MTTECPFKVGDKVTVHNRGWSDGPCEIRKVVAVKRRPEVVELDDKSLWRWHGHAYDAGSFSRSRIDATKFGDAAKVLRDHVASSAAAMRKEDWLKLSDEDVAAVDGVLRRVRGGSR